MSYRCQECHLITEVVYKYGFCRDCIDWFESLTPDKQKQFWKIRTRTLRT